MKILTVIGARPQIIKASALSRSIQKHYSGSIQEIIVHTGQHYDENMSDIFFRQLQIPLPKYNLNTGSMSHGQQTARMIEGIEQILLQESPDAIVVYGDTNSTLAGAFAASKIQVPVVHIEAGLRSFDKTMPEEINRILCDHVSTLLFCPTKTGYQNLINEGFSAKITPKPNFNTPNIYHCGDIMLDNTLYFKQVAANNSEYTKRYGKNFILCTVHRNTNTDDAQKMNDIFSSLNQIARTHRLIMPLHPRTEKMMPQMLESPLLQSIRNNPNIQIISPVGYLEMIYLESQSDLVITDSGGVQKEAYFLEKPCVILRPHTEWTEIVDTGNAIIAGTDPKTIIDSTENFLHTTEQYFPNVFGDGNAADFICSTILQTLG